MKSTTTFEVTQKLTTSEFLFLPRKNFFHRKMGQPRLLFARGPFYGTLRGRKWIIWHRRKLRKEEKMSVLKIIGSTVHQIPKWTVSLDG